MQGRSRKRTPYSIKMGKCHSDEDEMEKTGSRLGLGGSQSVSGTERNWWKADCNRSLYQVILVIQKIPSGNHQLRGRVNTEGLKDEVRTELDMEQQTGSKQEKEYIKAVYCHPAYLTYMQSTS